MTFCVGIKVKEGVVALADTRVVKGSEQLRKSKVSRHVYGNGTMFLMTSGLRSVRDKTCHYFEDQLTSHDLNASYKMFEAANLFGQQLRRVRAEDGPSLEAGGFRFNLHAILGGQLSGDSEPGLFLIYPEGNWIEATVDAPYHLIGRASYGKPILDRLLTADTPLGHAIALAFLAFDATRASVTDVDFPIDVVICDGTGESLREKRFDAALLADASEWWRQTLRAALAEFPLDWIDELSLTEDGA